MNPTVSARPYPWPYGGRVQPARTALVMIGPQAALAFTDPAGAVAERCAAALAAARAAGVIAVTVRYGRSPATPARHGFLPARASAGWAFLPALAPRPGEAVIEAPTLDAWHATDLDARLRRWGADHAILCGFGTEAGVHSTLRSANDRGYECLLLHDACAPLEPALQPAAVQTVTMSGGIFGAVAATSDLIGVLRETCV